MKAKVTVLVLGLSTSFVMNMMPSPSSAGFYEDLNKAIGNSGNIIEKTIQDAIRKPDQKTPAPSAPSAPPPPRAGTNQSLQGTATPLADRAKSSGNVILPSSGKIIGPDIVGLRVGMSPKEVQAILKKRNPDVTFRVIKEKNFQGLNVPYVDEESIFQIHTNDFGNASERSEAFKVMFSKGRAGQERATKIERFVLFKEQNGPTHRALLTALGKKYGTPTNTKTKKTGRTTGYHWIYDLNGRLKQNGRAVDSRKLYRCNRSFMGLARIVDSPNKVIKKRKNIHPDCGSMSLSVSAKVDKSNPLNSNAGLLESYNVDLLAYDEMAAATVSLATQRSQIKRQMAQQKIDQASKKKPEL